MSNCCCPQTHPVSHKFKQGRANIPSDPTAVHKTILVLINLSHIEQCHYHPFPLWRAGGGVGGAMTTERHTYCAIRITAIQQQTRIEHPDQRGK